MIRGLLVLVGILMVATGVTPFDIAGVHMTGNSFHELAVCTLALLVVLCATGD